MIRRWRSRWVRHFARWRSASKALKPAPMRTPEPYSHALPAPPAPTGSVALTRRAALRGLGGLGLGSMLLLQEPGVAFAQASAAAAGALPPAAQRDEFWTRDRTVWVRRTSTGELIKSTYWARGQL